MTHPIKIRSVNFYQMNDYEKLVGTMLDNRYKLKSIIGVGGMAT